MGMRKNLILMREVQKFAGPHIQEIIGRLVDKIADRHSHTQGLAVAGIANGGLVLGRRIAKALAERLGRDVPCGTVNIAFQRDDIGQKPIPLDAENTDFPFDVNEATVILVDDVYFSGRTARAAMNEVFDQGRPAALELAVLCDRGHRKLPIHPDYVGVALETCPTCRVTACFDENNPVNDSICVLEP